MRNADEIGFWADYVAGTDTGWIVDDAGVGGGLAADAEFVDRRRPEQRPARRRLARRRHRPGPRPRPGPGPGTDERGAVEAAARPGTGQRDPRRATRRSTPPTSPTTHRATSASTTSCRRTGSTIVDAGVFWPPTDDQLSASSPSTRWPAPTTDSCGSTSPDSVATSAAAAAAFYRHERARHVRFAALEAGGAGSVRSADAAVTKRRPAAAPADVADSCVDSWPDLAANRQQSWQSRRGGNRLLPGQHARKRAVRTHTNPRSPRFAALKSGSPSVVERFEVLERNGLSLFVGHGVSRECHVGASVVSRERGQPVESQWAVDPESAVSTACSACAALAAR